MWREAAREGLPEMASLAASNRDKSAAASGKVNNAASRCFCIPLAKIQLGLNW